MVCRKVHLNSIFAQGTLLDAHNTGAVYDDVDSRYIRPIQDFSSCGADGLLAGKVDVEGPIFHVGEDFLQGIDTLLDLWWTATGDDKVLRRLGCMQGG